MNKFKQNFIIIFITLFIILISSHCKNDNDNDNDNCRVISGKPPPTYGWIPDEPDFKYGSGFESSIVYMDTVIFNGFYTRKVCNYDDELDTYSYEKEQFFRAYQFDGKKIINLKNDSDYQNDFYSPIRYQDKLIFGGFAKKSSNLKIYLYDGNSIKNIEAGNSDYKFGFANPIKNNDKLFFSGIWDDEYQIYYYDGHEIQNVPIGNSGYQNEFENPLIYNNQLYFFGHYKNAPYSYYYYLYSLNDGTITRTTNVGHSRDMEGGAISFQNKIIFEAYSEKGKSLLYSYNGIENQILQKDNMDFESKLQSPIIYKDQLFFTDDYNIYKYDGNSIIQLNTESNSCYPRSIIFNEELYFACSSLQFKYNGIDLTSLYSIIPSNYEQLLYRPIVFDNKLFFSAFDRNKDGQVILSLQENQINLYPVDPNILKEQNDSSFYEDFLINPEIVFQNKLYFYSMDIPQKLFYIEDGILKGYNLNY